SDMSALGHFRTHAPQQIASRPITSSLLALGSFGQPLLSEGPQSTASNLTVRLDRSTQKLQRRDRSQADAPPPDAPHRRVRDERKRTRNVRTWPGDAKGKSTSGSNREAESTDAPERGGPPCSGD